MDEQLHYSKIFSRLIPWLLAVIFWSLFIFASVVIGYIGKFFG
jgi:hypothetical protein